MKNSIKILIVTFILISSCKLSTDKKTKPNIIIIYVDDLGYGDLGCYGATGVETPNIDRMAEAGIKFTDAHCSAATCTPSRFALLTGSYAFRNKAGILPGDAPLIIRPGTETIASMLKNAGYNTAVVGKWHLGLGDGNLNWNDSIKPGPLEIGFDYSFLIPATGDRVPCVYVENHHVVNLDTVNDPLYVSYKGKIGDMPTGYNNPELRRQVADGQHNKTIVNGISRIGHQAGGKAALWVDEEFPEVLTQKAKNFIEDNQNNPFFLFYSYHDIHVPRLPHERFIGKSEQGLRGDAIVQMDWCTGEIVKYLEELGIAENTLIIFTSDNGPVLNDGYEDQAVELLGDHKPAGPFRGGKYSAFEAGTRVPTIVYWPTKVKPGESDALISQVDILASLAKLISQPIASDAAPDSDELLNTWLGKTKKGREVMIEESFTLSLRQNEWKYIRPTPRKHAFISDKGIESGASKEPQLYNLNDDISEQNNLAGQMPDKVAELDSILTSIEEK